MLYASFHINIFFSSASNFGEAIWDIGARQMPSHQLKIWTCQHSYMAKVMWSHRVQFKSVDVTMDVCSINCWSVRWECRWYLRSEVSSCCSPGTCRDRGNPGLVFVPNTTVNKASRRSQVIQAFLT